jgi:small-conductance mechanosensitive channel
MFKNFKAFVAIALFTFLILVTPIALSQTSPQKTVQSSPGSEVTLDGKTLLTVHQKLLSSSVEKRAKAINQRISEFAEDTSVSVDALWIKDVEETMLVGAEDRILIYVSDSDGKVVGKSRQDLAKEYLQIIKDAVLQFREVRSSESLTLSAIYAIAATILLFVILIVWRWKGGTKQIDTWLNAQRQSRIPSLRIQNFELLSSDRITDLMIWFVGLIRLAVGVAIVYIYCSFVFSLFPRTKQLGATLFSYLEKGWESIWTAFLANLPNLFAIALVFTITYYVLRFLKIIFNAIGKKQLILSGFYPEWAEPTYKLLTYLIIAMSLAVVFPYVPGSGSDAFRGISIFLGVLISIGSSTAIANIVAGVIIIYTRAFQLSDRIKIGDIVGDVEEKLLLVTRIRTLNNVLVTIPNSILLTSNIINYSALIRDCEMPLILNTTITLGYDVPWRKIHETLIAAALKTDLILSEPLPFVLQTALNDFYVSYELKAYTQHPAEMTRIYSELHQNIQDKCNEVGIEICSPHYSALRDGNQSTIPENYLPKGYIPPSFRVDAKSD